MAEQLSNFLRKHLRAACFSPLSDRREVYWQGGHSYQFLSSMQDRPNRLKQCLYQPLSLVAYSSLSIQSASTLPACKTRCRRYPCLPCSRLQLHSCRRGQAPLAPASSVSCQSSMFFQLTCFRVVMFHASFTASTGFCCPACPRPSHSGKPIPSRCRHCPWPWPAPATPSGMSLCSIRMGESRRISQHVRQAMEGPCVVGCRLASVIFLLMPLMAAET